LIPHFKKDRELKDLWRKDTRMIKRQKHITAEGSEATWDTSLQKGWGRIAEGKNLFCMLSLSTCPTSQVGT